MESKCPCVTLLYSTALEWESGKGMSKLLGANRAAIAAAVAPTTGRGRRVPQLAAVEELALILHTGVAKVVDPGGLRALDSPDTLRHERLVAVAAPIVVKRFVPRRAVPNPGRIRDLRPGPVGYRGAVGRRQRGTSRVETM
jgi:hypothetical protein